MSQDNQTPTVDPDNEKGKLEIGWIVGIAVVAIVIGLLVLQLTHKTAPPQTGVVGPNRAPPTALQADSPANSLVPAH